MALINRINWLFLIGVFFTIKCVEYRLQGICRYDYYLLPLFFTIFTISLLNIHSFYREPGYTIFIIISVLRYCILPYYCSRLIQPVGFANNFNYIDDAILLMLYEIVCAFSFLIYRYKYSNKQHNLCRPIVYKHQPFFKLILVAFLIITIPNIPYYFRGISLLTQGQTDNDLGNYGLPVFVNLLWGYLLLMIYSNGIIQIKNFKISNLKQMYLGIILTLGMMIMIFVSQDKISRWHTILCTLSGYFFLRKAFPQFIKKINLFVIVPLAILICIATMFKQFNDNDNAIIDGYIASFLDAYLAGPVSVNNGIGLAENSNIGTSTMIVDILNNMPVVNHFINRDKSSPYLYNEYIGRNFYEEDSQGDQIVPLISQSHIYFGLLLSPLLTVFYIWLFSYFDKKYLICTNSMAFVYAFIACWCALCFILNITINFNGFWINIIPLWLLQKLFNIIRIAK